AAWRGSSAGATATRRQERPKARRGPGLRRTSQPMRELPVQGLEATPGAVRRAYDGRALKHITDLDVVDAVAPIRRAARDAGAALTQCERRQLEAGLRRGARPGVVRDAEAALARRIHPQLGAAGRGVVQRGDR